MRVEIARNALRDTDRFLDWAKGERWPFSKRQRWHQGMMDASDSLEVNPERCVLAPECEWWPFEVRELLYGLDSRYQHRILFSIDENCVTVRRVWPGRADYCPSP